MPKHHFHIWDFVVFGSTIVISLGIGVYYALSGGRQRTTSEYLVGGRSMSYIPVAISLIVSFESSIMILGSPAESYVYGIQQVMLCFGFLVSQLLSIFVIVPLLHPLKITSAYEYLELRFQSRKVRLLGTFLGILSYIWYMGIVLFGPAVALEAVVELPIWISIFIIEIVAILYTSFGGLKAVIWTDVFQAFVMFAGMFAILIKGTLDSGGAASVWKIADQGGRLNFFDFDPDPRTRHTFWNLFVGNIIRGFGLSFNQSTVQRISSTKSQGEAKRMLMYVAPAFFVIEVLAIYEGVVAYAYYQTQQCDPFESKQINDPNQIIPYMVMDMFTPLPGMPGLFLASLFSASLSTLSSGLSSLAALLWADVIHPVVGPNISEFKATCIAKVSVVFFGIAAIGIAILVSQIGGVLSQISSSIISAFSGPLTGIFFLGCFFPRATATGTITGGLVGMIVCSWLSLGMNFSPAIQKTPWLPPASILNCTTTGDDVNRTEMWSTSWLNVSSLYLNETSTQFSMSSGGTTEALARQPEGVELLYTLSYRWISPLGTLITIMVGLLASVLTGANKPGDVDPRYLLSVSDSLLIYLPGPIRRWLSSLGPQYMKEEYKDLFPDPTKLQDELHADINIQVAGDTDYEGDNLLVNNGKNSLIELPALEKYPESLLMKVLTTEGTTERVEEAINNISNNQNHLSSADGIHTQNNLANYHTKPH